MKKLEEKWELVHPGAKQKFIEFLKISVASYFYLLQKTSDLGGSELHIKQAGREINSLIQGIEKAMQEESRRCSLPFNTLWRVVFQEKNFSSREWLVLIEIQRKLALLRSKAHDKEPNRKPRFKIKKGYLKG